MQQKFGKYQHLVHGFTCACHSSVFARISSRISSFPGAMLTLASLSLSAGIALAADIPQGESGGFGERGWVVQVTPYLWAAGIDGDISPFEAAPTISIEKSFSDILEDLNFGGFVNLYARNDRFIFNADAMYVNTTDSKVIGSLPVIGPTPGLSADVDTIQFTSTLEAGYRLYDAPQFTFDILAGARIWYVSNDVTVRYAGYSLSHDEDFSWVDPVVAARAFLRVTDRLSFLFHGDIGGFGVASDFTWQALGTVNYDLTDKWTLSAGYKALSVDYDSGGHVFDTTLSGPVLGATFRF